MGVVPNYPLLLEIGPQQGGGGSADSSLTVRETSEKDV